MAMRETVGSLRAYFALVAVISGLFGVLEIVQSEGILLLNIIFSLRLVLDACYFYSAIALPRLLRDRVIFVRGTIISNFAYLIAMFGVTMSLLPPEQAGQQSVGLLVGVLISWYLLTNVNRLAKEAQEQNVAPAPPKP